MPNLSYAAETLIQLDVTMYPKETDTYTHTAPWIWKECVKNKIISSNIPKPTFLLIGFCFSILVLLHFPLFFLMFCLLLSRWRWCLNWWCWWWGYNGSGRCRSSSSSRCGFLWRWPCWWRWWGITSIFLPSWWVGFLELLDDKSRHW